MNKTLNYKAAAVKRDAGLKAAGQWNTETDPYTLALYDPSPTLPFTQSPALLSDWLSLNHPQYNVASWCFYGNIRTSTGDIIAINSVVQQQFGFKDTTPYLAEFSICDDKTKGYAIAPFFIEFLFDIQFNNPFNTEVSYFPIPKINLKLSLVSGTMGVVGAQYKMSGLVVDINLNEWKYDLLLTDTLGVIQVGYGPSSFMPQWLLLEQQRYIMDEYHGSVHDFLNATKDPMLGQGSYYYSFPLLSVNSCNILQNGKPYITANSGNIWMDYVVQGFNAQSMAVVEAASWQFFAIQFPAELSFDGFNAALVVSIVTTEDNNVLPSARFYVESTHAERTQNGALKPYMEWNTNQITYTPVKYWTDDQGQKYPVEFNLLLDSPEGVMTVTATAVRDNQVVNEVKKYEGVFNVIASMDINEIQKPFVQGYAWAEVH